MVKIVKIEVKETEDLSVAFTKMNDGGWGFNFSGVRTSEYLPREFFQAYPFFALVDEKMLLSISAEQRFDLIQGGRILPTDKKRILDAVSTANIRLNSIMLKEQNKDIGKKEIFTF